MKPRSYVVILGSLALAAIAGCSDDVRSDIEKREAMTDEEKRALCSPDGRVEILFAKQQYNLPAERIANLEVSRPWDFIEYKNEDGGGDDGWSLCQIAGTEPLEVAAMTLETDPDDTSPDQTPQLWRFHITDLAMQSELRDETDGVPLRQSVWERSGQSLANIADRLSSARYLGNQKYGDQDLLYFANYFTPTIGTCEDTGSDQAQRCWLRWTPVSASKSRSFRVEAVLTIPAGRSDDLATLTGAAVSEFLRENISAEMAGRDP